MLLQEEVEKRKQRAAKFGLPAEREDGLKYEPDPEVLKRAARAKKFGSQPPTADTLLQKAGGCSRYSCQFKLIDNCAPICILQHW
jgi:hypothetical protein